MGVGRKGTSVQGVSIRLGLSDEARSLVASELTEFSNMS